MNYEQALSYIHSLQRFGSILGLERIKELCSKLGNPQNELKFIHVAGTNGKGSTCNMLSNIFIKAGHRVGLYTSPYVVDFRERIQLNGEYIEKSELARLCEKVKNTGVEVTEFEFITALAFLYFKEKGCDIVVLEVGLGGRFDATNVIREPFCSVITRIDLDHTDYLGNTIEKIAMEKCGIIKNGCPVVAYPLQEPSALKVVESIAEKLTVPDLNKLKILKSDISGNSFIYKGIKYKTRLAGVHQIYNAVTVIETAYVIGGISDDNIKDGIAETAVPARVELIGENPTVVLDGSHNPDGAEALLSVMKNYDKDIVAIIGMMADKDCELFLKKTLPFCSSVITVTVKENARSISAEALKELAIKYCSDVSVAASYDEAIKTAGEKSDNKKPIFVCGSLYLSSAIRENLIKTFK